MSAYRGVDYLLFDSLLSEEELLVRQTARQFVEDRLVPVIRDCYRDGRFPAELIPEMGELGGVGRAFARSVVAKNEAVYFPGMTWACFVSTPIFSSQAR